MQATMEWQKSLGWDQSQSRRIQLSTGISGLIILFAGVVMQWWAGNNIADMELGTFCHSYSGDSRTMQKSDWNTLKLLYYKEMNPSGSFLGLENTAKVFFGATGKNVKSQIEDVLYSEPSFWCKSLPKCPTGAVCEQGVISQTGPTFTPGAWKGRYVSDAPYWNQPDNSFGLASPHIRCYDQYMVYREMLTEMYTDNLGGWVLDPVSKVAWSEDAVNAAASAVLYQCYTSKGSTGYILGTGPVLSTFACLFCIVSLFTCCPRSYTAALGRGLAIMAFAMSLIGFWVIVFTSVREFADAYIFCDNLESPLVIEGMYFDGTPCVDRTSQQGRETNPFFYWSGFTTGVYTVGGAFNIIAVILLLVSIAKTIEDQQLRKFATLTPSDEL